MFHAKFHQYLDAIDQEAPTMMSKRNRYVEFPILLFIVVLTGVATRWFSWPGFATHDTLWITGEAIAGHYTTYHPLLNTLLVRLLAVPFDSYWLYTSLQIALCCTLLYQSLRHVLNSQGSPWVAVVAVLAWALSVHTWLYLGMVWKDVPIAYALVFMASLAYRIRSEPDYRPTLLDALLLGTCLLACIGLRHGMTFNVILVPMLLGWRKVIGLKTLWVPIAFAVLGFGTLQLLGATKMVQNDEAHMLKLKISAISQPFLAIVSNRNGYTSDDYVYDRRLAESTFGSAYASDFTPDYFRNTVVPTSEHERAQAYRAILKRTPTLCAINFSQCVSARIQMFLGTLQPSTSHGGMTFYDLGLLPDCINGFGMSGAQCEILDEFVTSEKSQAALGWQREFQQRFVESSAASVKLLVWNLLPALALLVAILVLGRAQSPIWLVAVFFLVQLLLPFMTAMANDFRYYYFLFPFAIVFTPAALQHLMNAVRARWRRPAVHHAG